MVRQSARLVGQYPAGQQANSPVQRAQHPAAHQSPPPLPEIAPEGHHATHEWQPDSGPNEKAEVFDSKKRQRSKTFSIIDGSMYSASAGLTGSFISAFAIALGSSNTVIALLSTLPNLIAAVVQLGVQKARRFFKSRKTYLVFFATLQALMWLPLIFIPALSHPGWWLLLFITINTVFGMLLGPIWNSFMSDVVEEDERGRFFGRRNMFTGLTAFIATIAAGWILSVLKPVHPFLGFGILFGLACAFRLMSAYYLSLMDDPPEAGLGTEEPDPLAFARNVDKTPLGRFTIFLMLFNVAVYLASPFFAVYELSILRFDYFTFTMLACASAVSSFLTMLWWGKHVDRIGSKNVLVACGFLIPLVPFLWTLTVNPWVLLWVEIFSGMIWAGFNLSVSTYLFDATERKNRTRQLAEYTLMIQLAVFSGAIAGSMLLGMMDTASRASFITIFIISAALRLAVVLIFYKTLQELRIIEVPIKGRLFKKFITIKPHHGVVYETAVENPSDTQLRKLRAREIKEDLAEYARKMRGERNRESPIKELERKEDEQDSEDYLRRLKK